MNIAFNMSGGELENATATELRLLVAAMQTGWLQEHNVDGTHNRVIDVAPTADMFSGVIGGAASDFTWHASQGYQKILYRLRSDLLWVQVHLDGFSVANTPSYLRMLIPGGFEAYQDADGGEDGATTVGYAFDSGTNRLMTVNATGRYLACVLVPAANWANSTMNTGLAWTCEFRVNNRRGQ